MTILLTIFAVLYWTLAGGERAFRSFRKQLHWIVMISWFTVLFLFRESLGPFGRLALACAGTLWLLKEVVRLESNQILPAKPALQLISRFIWPGMSTDGFISEQAPTEQDGALFVRGFVSMVAGACLAILLAAGSHLLGDTALGLSGLVPFFLLVHFGYASVLTASLRFWGNKVPDLFDAPFKSRSLREFWSKRWNLPFAQMNRSLFLPVLLRKLGHRGAILGTFAISGLLHELGISYPAGAGWGLPTAYFLFHGFLFLAEGSAFYARLQEKRILRLLWVWGTLLLPLPLLFHESFRAALIVPAYRDFGAYIHSFSMSEHLRFLLLLAGLGHFLVIAAAVQVPTRLDWKHDLAKLTPLNRKVMWNYGFFIFLLICSFGAFTIRFRSDMVDGVPAASAMAGLFGCFWLLRLLVDGFYFSHSDWPGGPQFVAGHAMLATLFGFLAAAYGTVLTWSFL